MIFLFILITCLLDNAWILWGKILSWSLMGVKGLRDESKVMMAYIVHHVTCASYYLSMIAKPYKQKSINILFLHLYHFPFIWKSKTLFKAAHLFLLLHITNHTISETLKMCPDRCKPAWHNLLAAGIYIILSVYCLKEQGCNYLLTRQDWCGSCLCLNLEYNFLQRIKIKSS